MSYRSLIPAYRIMARKRRARVRLWVVVCAVQSLALAGGAALCHALLGGEDLGLAAELQETTNRIRSSRADIGPARVRLRRSEARLLATQGVANEPDWSILLASIAAKPGEGIVLQQCELQLCKRHADSARQPGERRPHGMEIPASDGRGYLFTLRGHARSHRAASEFVMKLEKAAVFDQVRLVRNTREPFLSGSAIAFEVACAITEGSGAAK
ncbi:MAG: hypothetical protein AMK72_09960 [Planctomycetes bacterium SM23_25]|nr:MAG: hypothetical protein AMK72_09960 [Planctomycetes bacterium SM23_25]